MLILYIYSFFLLIIGLVAIKLVYDETAWLTNSSIDFLRLERNLYKEWKLHREVKKMEKLIEKELKKIEKEEKKFKKEKSCGKERIFDHC